MGLCVDSFGSGPLSIVLITWVVPQSTCEMNEWINEINALTTMRGTEDVSMMWEFPADIGKHHIGRQKRIVTGTVQRGESIRSN